MTNDAIQLSKSEWRQVADVAARIDWARYTPGRYAALEAGLTDRSQIALHQLLRAA